MEPLKIIKKYYQVDSKSYRFLVEHSQAVAQKALAIAKKLPHLKPDLKFIEEAAMLHDIGIFLTDDLECDCHGGRPYVCHGYLGRKILEKEGLPKHALACERHVGTGLTIKDIENQKLPLPKREMVPISIEEQIICYADKFFSKNEGKLSQEKSLNEVRESLGRFGNDKIDKFNKWGKQFGY